MKDTNDKYIPFEYIAVIIASFFFTFAMLIAFAPKRDQEVITHPPVQQLPLVPPSEPAQPPRTVQISNPFPGYQSYSQIKKQLKEWESEAEDFVETGVYGKSTRNEDLWYICLTNEKKDTYGKLRTLVTASIHGNEPWSTSTTMGYIGAILDNYGKDESITNLVDSRELYFIPVVSPDSYPRSRHVDDVDPNRDFPTAKNPNKISVPPVQALRDFFLSIKPNAVISGHTYGRVYLHPWGDKREYSSNHDDYRRILDVMTRESRYRYIRACEMYKRPIFGTEVDWYYRNGAMAIVMEFGTHQRIPTSEETRSEFDRTYKAVCHFLKEAPEVQVSENWWNYHPYLRTLYPSRLQQL